MTVGHGSDLRRGIDVGLRNERVERDGQQHHAQQKCAPRHRREATCLCSLLPRQQLNNQRLNAVNVRCVIAHSRAEQNLHPAVPLQSANHSSVEQDRCNPEARSAASGRQYRVLAVTRLLQCINRRVTPSLDFDAARSLIVTPSRCWTGRRRSFRHPRFSEHRHQEHECNLQQELPGARLLVGWPECYRLRCSPPSLGGVSLPLPLPGPALDAVAAWSPRRRAPG